jgi:hypothetical protein
MGTSSWGFGGWGGIVWDRAYPDDRLSREGLGAYAAHPLLRTVGVDRTHYRPMSVEELAALVGAVGGDCTLDADGEEGAAGDGWPEVREEDEAEGGGGGSAEVAGGVEETPVKAVESGGDEEEDVGEGEETVAEDHGGEARGEGEGGEAPEFEGESDDDIGGDDGEEEGGGDAGAVAAERCVADGCGDAEEEADGGGDGCEESGVAGGAEETGVFGELGVPLGGEAAPLHGGRAVAEAEDDEGEDGEVEEGEDGGGVEAEPPWEVAEESRVRG